MNLWALEKKAISGGGGDGWFFLLSSIAFEEGNHCMMDDDRVNGNGGWNIKSLYPYEVCKFDQVLRTHIF